MATPESAPNLTHLSTLFTEWGIDSLATLMLIKRSALFDPGLLAAVETATAVLFAGGDSRSIAPLIGGTPVAQAIRRANAQAKIIGAVASAASLLCQHMLCADDQGALSFAPGLGVINRITVAPPSPTSAQPDQALISLLKSIAANPFLFGLRLAADTGAVVYADSTLEVFGANQVDLLDSSATSCEDLGQITSLDHFAQHHIRLHQLSAGHTYNLDSRISAPPRTTDIPATGLPENTSSF